MTDRALREVIRIKHGYAFQGEGFRDDPAFPVVVTPGNFATTGGFQEAKLRTFEGDFPTEYLLDAGALIVTMTDLSKDGATLGLGAIVPAGRAYLHNQRIGLVQIIDARSIDSGYLNYLMRTSGYRAHVLGTASGSTVRHTSPSRILDYRVDLPPLPEQRAIAEVLGALDDKIASNRVVISSAMKRAEAEFAHTLVESHEARLGDVLRLEYGKALPAKSRAGGDVAVYGSGGVIGYHDTPLVDGQGVVVGRKGSAGSVYWAAGPHFPIDTTYFVATTDERVCAQFAYFLLKGQDLAGLNADSAVPGLNRNEAYALPIRVPKASKAHRFQQISAVLFAISDAKVKESHRLAATRDALLPLLMSGKVRVKDVEDEVGELV